MTRTGSRAHLPIVLSLLACAACPGTLANPAAFDVSSTGSDAGTTPPTTAAACPDVPTLLAQTCGVSGCHDSTTKAEALDLASPGVTSRLVGVSASEGAGLLIDPAAPSSSVLYTKLLAKPPFGARMPTTAPLDASTLECVLAWVTSEAGSTPSAVNSGAAPVADAGVDLDAGSAADTGVSFATIRVAAGQTTAVTDAKGNVWSADLAYTGGTPAVEATPIAITGTDTPALYNGQRYGDPMFSYVFPVPDDTYTVTLKFAELYVTAAGMREFGIAINGTPVETNFDIYAAAGGMNAAVDESFTVNVSGGSIAIDFTAGAIQNPKVDAIQITRGSAPADGGADP